MDELERLITTFNRKGFADGANHPQAQVEYRKGRPSNNERRAATSQSRQFSS